MPLATGCINEHVCGAIKTVEDGHVLSPWVKATFRGGDGALITVGNESSPSLDNSATIKSFDFGISTGSECKIVIHDTQGSSLSVFMKNMLKDLFEGDVAQRSIIIEWGWTKSGCPTPPPSTKSEKHYLQIRTLETNFVQGKFIHEIGAFDTLNAAVEGAVEMVFGEDWANAITLKEAIRKLFTEKPYPIVKSVKYCRIEKGQVVENVNFADPDPDGPKASWKSNCKNKLEIAKEWVKGWPTDRNKTFLPTYNTKVDGGEIIFWEKPVVGCDENATEDLCIGTYIVNGGLNTPVIEFNPRIKWDFSSVPVPGGQQPGEQLEGAPKNKEQGIDGCPQLSRPTAVGSGQTKSTPASNIHKDVFGKDAAKKNAEANAKQAMQIAVFITDKSIEADMVIVGDPKFPTQLEGVIDGKFIAVAYVNPFHLMPASGSCGEWMAKPPCNEILSNKSWQIKRVNHKIADGTYTISLGLYLATPGIDIMPDKPLGGAPDGAVI